MDITIKNFKIFDDNGVKLTLSPITFLTGENSSGKSSVTKALLLLQNYFSKAKDYQKLPFENINFSKYNLPDFDDVINYNSNCNKITYITKIKSKMLDRDLSVEYIFEKKEGDDLNNAWLSNISVWDLESNDRVYHWSIDDNKQSFNALFFKKYFFNFAKDFLNKKSLAVNNKAVFKVSDVDKYRYVDILKKAIEYNIIFYFEIIDDILNKNREEQLDYFSNYVLESKSKKLIQKITDFINSDKQFIDYYIQSENDVLKNIEILDKYRFLNVCTLEYNYDNFVQTIKSINSEINKSKFNVTSKATSINIFEHSYISEILYRYINLCLQEILIPETLKKDVYFIGADNIYTHTTNEIVQDYYDSKTFSKNNILTKPFGDFQLIVDKIFKPHSFINEWINKLGIADSIEFNKGKIYLIKNNKKTLLSNEGLGTFKLVLTLILIESKIISADIGVKEELMDFFDDQIYFPTSPDYPIQTIILEEPEAHLHPKLQSQLCDILLDAYKKYNIHFVIETHSEYIIRKSQILVKNMNFNSNEQSEKESPFRTYYFPVGDNPYSLGYRKDGKFVEKFGKGFFDEASDLIFEIL